MTTQYDSIGDTYATQRRTEPRIAALIWQALGDASSVVNVGAGAGSYEPSDRWVVAVEPSRVMLEQRCTGAAPTVQAVAEALPLGDDSVDAAMVVLSLHHWSDPQLGLAECARVARDRVVILTWDPASTGFWLVQEYFPDLLAVDREIFPSITDVASWLGSTSVVPVPIPSHCCDGFLGAYWRRPEAYLDPDIRRGMSSFGRLSNSMDGLARLTADLKSGEWNRRFGQLLTQSELDIGYRLVVASV
jgi:SAM-dependent methyltransferase